MGHLAAELLDVGGVRERHDDEAPPPVDVGGVRLVLGVVKLHVRNVVVVDDVESHGLAHELDSRLGEPSATAGASKGPLRLGQLAGQLEHGLHELLLSLPPQLGPESALGPSEVSGSASQRERLHDGGGRATARPPSGAGGPLGGPSKERCPRRPNGAAASTKGARRRTDVSHDDVGGLAGGGGRVPPLKAGVYLYANVFLCN